jgi:soluble P-type ATPase
MKPGITIEIPGFGRLDLRALVSDYTGTLACGGTLVAGVAERLARLDPLLDLHVLTSDTFGTARRELASLPVRVVVLEGENHDVQKARFVRDHFVPRHVVALGNGHNDRMLLQGVREAGGLAIAVDAGEGCAFETLRQAHLLIRGPAEALDLLLDPRRLKATLRF